MDLVLAQAQPPGPIAQLLPLGLIILVFYFLLIRPQQKRQSEHKSFVEGLKKNDKVVTISGLYGRVTEVRQDDVTLEISNGVSVQFEREQIRSYQGEKKEV